MSRGLARPQKRIFKGVFRTPDFGLRTRRWMSAFGYKRTFTRLVIYVRFTPESGHLSFGPPRQTGIEAKFLPHIFHTFGCMFVQSSALVCNNRKPGEHVGKWLKSARGNGAGDGIRTHDFNLGKVALYP